MNDAKTRTIKKANYYLRIYDRKEEKIIHSFLCPDKKYAYHLSKVLFCVFQRKFGDRDLSLTVVQKEDKNKAPGHAVVKEDTGRTKAYKEDQVEKRLLTLEATVLAFMKEIKLNNELRSKSVTQQSTSAAQ